MLALIIIITVLSTFAGGAFAFFNQDKMHRILGFSAGIILGLVAFEILPEVFELSSEQGISSIYPMLGLVVGFLTLHVVEKMLIIHGAHEGEYGHHRHPKLGMLSALALAGHSLIDGMSIGLAFKLNTTVGLAVAMTVIAHDFVDGLNTVSLMLSHKNSKRTTLRYLLLDAIMPVVGLVLALVLPIPANWLVVLLGFFAGTFLYICAADILPEAHSKHPSGLTLVLTVMGVALIFAVTQLSAW